MSQERAFNINQTKYSDSGNISWDRLGIHTYVKIAVIAALFASLFHNEIGKIVNRWVTDPSWSHGFLIPFFSIYFINQKKSEILSLKPKPSYIGLVLMICGIVFYPLNIVSPSGFAYFQPIGMIATLGAIVLFLGGWKLIKYTWLPIAYLVFAVPLPQRHYVALTMPLRRLATIASTALLNLVNDVYAVSQGVVVEVTYQGQKLAPLDVADACSGMRLLMAFLALGVAMAYLHYRPAWQRFILLTSTIPIAIFCNVIRVTVTGFIYVLGNPKYAKGIYHDGLGMAMLLLAFVLYALLAWAMESLFVDEKSLVTEDVIIRRNPDRDAD